MTDKLHARHSLERTSPKGEGSPFRGTCRLCGKQDLPAEAVFDYCENPRNLTTGETLLESVLGPEKTNGEP
jgi:hypothetical protein